jgi:hypothetical protein
VQAVQGFVARGHSSPSTFCHRGCRGPHR